jgi:hypothetical protein
MKSILFLFFGCFISLHSLATAQYPDKIVYQGETHDLLSNPMESYFEKYPDKRPRGGIMSTALWRGYVASFEIRDDQLFLKDIEVKIPDSTNKKSYEYTWKSVINEVLPDKEPLKIDWMTGLLVIPGGKIVNYVHMGYGSTYENYILLALENGDLKDERRYNYKEYETFKERQFKAFKKTDEYKKLKADLLKQEGYDEKFIDSFLKSFVTSYTSKILVD